ncbi:hypothetical protein BDB00DRAFT_875386 [Zychaea mexicana]|uniref:uncharacterized protein n=1 Tax=Zychaea mexicana TaxID=64656 RepID=UPI0022FF2781|nr:uncharacterized protein BDB00DRAFT_875386 [Zychaea mexicana]KAI9490329.1 hypothetical protein BDB00DRAFT_875386 [Zychaea mexicana]
MAGAVGAGVLAVATYNNYNNRQPKVEELDPATFEDQQIQAGQQEQYDPYRPNPHASWLSQASAIDPFGTAAAYNYATQLHQASAATSSVERPPTTVIRESTYNNLHASIFHVSAPPEDNTVPAGGGAYVPAFVPTIHDQSRQSPEMDAFGGNGGGGDGGKRGSWLLKKIAARWQQGWATGAHASDITATTDASSVNNDSSTSNTTDESKQQRPQHIQTDSGDNSNNNKGRMLWDIALASAGGSTVARSASTASTNPFRSSMSTHRDSVISALRIPLIQEDAWTLEDHAAMSNE